VKYPYFPSAMRPVPQREELSVLKPPEKSGFKRWHL